MVRELERVAGVGGTGGGRGVRPAWSRAVSVCPGVPGCAAALAWVLIPPSSPLTTVRVRMVNLVRRSHGRVSGGERHTP